MSRRSAATLVPLLLIAAPGPMLAATPPPQQLQMLLTPEHLPKSLPAAAAGQNTRVINAVPTQPWGLQLCSTGRRGLQVSIPGPRTRTELVLPLVPLAKDGGQQVLSASLYRFASTAAASSAWMALQQAIKRCTGTVRSDQGLASTLSQGSRPAPWVLNEQRDNDPSDAAVLYAVFRQQHQTIVVTRLSRAGASSISPAEQQGIQELAAGISTRLEAGGTP